MPPETPHPPVRFITADVFHEGPAYRSWRTKGTNDWLIILTLGGAGRFGHANGELMTTAGDVVIIKPNTHHDYRSHPMVGKWDLAWAHFHPRTRWLEWLDWPNVAQGIGHLRLPTNLFEDITAKFNEVNLLANGARRRREELAMNTLENILLLVDSVNPKAEALPVDARVRDAMDYACRNLSAELSLPVLADVAGLSLSRFAHLFREQVGVTPQQFIEQQRINQARQLLELGSRSIKQIAVDVGFDTQFYFSQRFRKWVGKSPREYRQHVKGKIV